MTPFNKFWRVHLAYDVAMDDIAIRIACKQNPKEQAIQFSQSFVAMPLTFESSASKRDFAPLIDVDSRGLIQEIVDAAWAVGIRPQASKGTDSEIAALRYHLEDMRLLAKVKKP